jgi:hypothetical protein
MTRMHTILSLAIAPLATAVPSQSGALPRSWTGSLWHATGDDLAK